MFLITTAKSVIIMSVYIRPLLIIKELNRPLIKLNRPLIELNRPLIEQTIKRSDIDINPVDNATLSSVLILS